MLDARCSMLDARCSMLDARCSMLDARCSMLDARCSMRQISESPCRIVKVSVSGNPKSEMGVWADRVSSIENRESVGWAHGRLIAIQKAIAIPIGIAIL